MNELREPSVCPGRFISADVCSAELTPAASTIDSDDVGSASYSLSRQMGPGCWAVTRSP